MSKERFENHTQEIIDLSPSLEQYTKKLQKEFVDATEGTYHLVASFEEMKVRELLKSRVKRIRIDTYQKLPLIYNYNEE